MISHRLTHVAPFAVMLAVCVSVTEPGLAQDRPSARGIQFDIPSQPLEGALLAFSHRANVQLLYDADLVAGRRSRPLTGRYSPIQAIHILLRGTGLQVRQSGADAITLIRVAEASGIMTLDTMAVLAPRRLGEDSAQRNYGASVQRAIADLLRRNPATSHGRYTVELHVWLDEAGHVRDARVAGSSGNTERDAAVAATAIVHTMPEPPPTGMKQPIRLEFDARRRAR